MGVSWLGNRSRVGVRAGSAADANNKLSVGQTFPFDNTLCLTFKECSLQRLKQEMAPDFRHSQIQFRHLQSEATSQKKFSLGKRVIKDQFSLKSPFYWGCQEVQRRVPFAEEKFTFDDIYAWHGIKVSTSVMTSYMQIPSRKQSWDVAGDILWNYGRRYGGYCTSTYGWVISQNIISPFIKVGSQSMILSRFFSGRF